MHRHRTGVRIDLDFGDLGSERKRQRAKRFRRVKEATAHHEAPFPTVQRLVRNLREGQSALRTSGHKHVAPAEHDILRAGLEQIRGNVGKLLTGILTGCFYRVARRERSALSESTPVKRRDIRIALHHAHVLRPCTQHLSGNHAHDRVRALPHVRNTGIQRHDPVVGDFHHGRRRIVVRTLGAGSLCTNADADTPIAGQLAVFVFPGRTFGNCLQTLLQAAGSKYAAVRRLVTRIHGVLQVQFQRVHAELFGDMGDVLHPAGAHSAHDAAVV